MRFGSVCSGIEAASVAWNPLGWKAAWLAEIEPFPSAVLAHYYPDIPNYGDMTKLPARIASGEIEAPDVFCGGTPCFTAGHMVLSASGYVPIESLQVGDLVVTHNGRLRPVVRIGSKLADVGILAGVGITEPIVCTPEHPFMSVAWSNQNTRRGRAYAKVEHCGNPEWVAAKDLQGRQWCQLTSHQAVDVDVRSTKFTPKTAMYLAGMYLGDGWIRKHEGKRKKSVLLGLNPEKYQKLKAAIGNSVHTVTEERTTTRVEINDTEFAEWLDENFSHYSHLKTIPSWVLGHEFKAEFLRGFLDTDGCVFDDGKISISSTSRSLSYGISDLLATEGYVSSVAFVKTPDTCVIEGREVNQRDYYQVRGYPQSISRKSRVRHGMILRAVSGYTSSGEDTVFNIEVDEDHSYIVQGAVVHNCQAFSVAGKRESLADARGNLSLIFCDIADSIDAARHIRGLPASIVSWENVPGVLSTKDNAFGCFLAQLCGGDEPLNAPDGWPDAGCVSGPSRTAAWRVLDAQYFGLAQRRKRVFVVASARNDFDPAAVLFEWDGVRRDFAPSREAREEVAGTLGARTHGGGGLGTDFDVAGGVPPVAGTLCIATGQGGAEIGAEIAPTLNCNHEAPYIAKPTFAAAFKGGQGSAAGSIGYSEHVAPTLSSADSGSNRTPVVLTHVPTIAFGWQNSAAQGDSCSEHLSPTLDKSKTPAIAASSLPDSWQNKGFNILESLYASPQEADTIALLQRVRKAIGAQAFAQWGLGILDSLQQAEILRSALHGSELRPAAFSRRWVVCCTLGSPFSRSAGAMHSMREAAGERCSPQGWGFSEQHFDELGAYLSELSRPGAQAERLMRHLWQASKGVGVLRDALSAIQEAWRPAGHQGQPVHPGSQGLRTAPAEGLQSAGLHGQVPLEGVLQQTRPASNQGDAGATATDQERGGFGAMAVRRLTVEECEFLQGFPRGYTAVPNRGKPAADGPRYKALGNSWAIPCVSWICKRIKAAL